MREIRRVAGNAWQTDFRRVCAAIFAARTAVKHTRLLLSRNEIKYVRSLSVKKYRDAEGVFVAESPKLVADLLPLLRCRRIYFTDDFRRAYPSALNQRLSPQTEAVAVTQAELERLSLLRQPHGALALFETPRRDGEDFATLLPLPSKGLCLALDDVQDPGNLGTILRVADWFGIRDVFATAGTADAYSPKVVQATMGAIGRVRVHTVDLVAFLSALADEGGGVPVYGTFLDGCDIHSEPLRQEGVIVMGNEGRGVSPGVAALVTSRLLVPSYPADVPTSESLNVAVATAVVCAEFRRRAAR